MGAVFGAATYLVSFYIDKYIFKTKEAFSRWQLSKNIIIGAARGFLSGANVSKIMSMVITFSSGFLYSYKKGKIIKTIIFATIMTVVSLAMSGNKTVLNNKTLKKYSKTLYRKITTGNIKSAISQFLKRTSKYISEYVSNSFLTSFISLFISKINSARRCFNA